MNWYKMTRNKGVEVKLEGAMDSIATRLDDLKGRDLYRSCRVLENLKGTTATLNGKEITLFCGNDYLGLSRHPKVIAAAEEALLTYGVGAGSARLIAGTTDLHDALEERLAKFLEKERALVFSSGYLANLGVLSALPEESDLIAIDKLSHASVIDAARMSKAKMRVYPHKNLAYLEKILRANSSGRAWIVTDSVFSMDGDLAPLRELATLKQRYGAMLVVDEAHGIGVFGSNGRGVSEELGILGEVDIYVGTLSKAFGALGGFVTAQSPYTEALKNIARTFIYDTALPPSICSAAIASCDIIPTCPEIRLRLKRNAETLRANLKEAGVPVLSGTSPIIPAVIGDEKKAIRVADNLIQDGLFIPAIRYPTVSKGKARLRITVSAAHTIDQISRLVGALSRALSG